VCDRHGALSSLPRLYASLQFLQIATIIGGMADAVRQIEDFLTERFAREREATLELVFRVVERLLNEQIRRDGEAHGRELEQLSAKIQASFDRIEGVLEQQADRIDRAARGEPLDRMN
jgi:hypothetical protein